MRCPRLVLATSLVLLSATHAFADATLFIGRTSTPTARTARGFAIGASVVAIGFEFEFSSTRENALESAPSLSTGVGNLILQSPGAIAGLRPYFTTGVGGYRERLADRQETHVLIDTGGGVKVSLFGPLRARFDYRVFKLRGEPLHATVHRVYLGANLAF